MLLRIIWTIFSLYFVASTNVNVYVDTDPIRTVSEKFLSIALDSDHAKSPDWHGLNFTFITPLTRALGPAYFRFGGTFADLMIFRDNTNNNASNKLMNATEVSFTSDQLDQLYNFSKNAGWSLIFGLNLMLRSGDKWDPSNAQDFINYASSKGYEMNFELGNEPDYFPRADQFNITISGTQIAEDYQVLRNLLNSKNLYKNSVIMGPSVSYIGDLGRTILIDFLKNGGGNIVNGLTFHQYYVDGAKATTHDFLDYQRLDKLKGTLLIANSLNYSHMWIGETASCYAGGAVNMSDSFIDGFLWLDKLGLSALHNMEIVIRQQLFGAYYSVLNQQNLPNADYWLSLVYKKLVGTQVYNLTFDPVDPHLRLYAASSKNINNGIVVYGVKLSNDSSIIDFPNISTKQATVYVLKEGESGNLLSKTSKLNDVLLEWKTHQPGSNYQGVASSLPVTIPGYSHFFIVLNPNTETTCPNGWYKETTNSNKCVKFVTEVQPLFGAKFDCTTYENNVSIISISSAFENTELLKMAQAQNCSQFYTGLYRNGNNWSWSNGDSSSYINWKSGYPTNDSTKNCVVFDAMLGTWYNNDCDTSQCYICQKLA